MNMQLAQPAPPRYSAQNPFLAQLVRKLTLTGSGSEKETIHYELSLAGSGLAFEPGDSLGILPRNDPQLVDELLKALGLDGDATVTVSGADSSDLRSILIRDRTITKPSTSFLSALAEKSGRARLRALVSPEKRKELQDYLWGRDILDLILEHPEIRGRFDPEEFVKLLAKLQPRLYSLASSLRAHPDTAHLLIVTVKYESHGRSHSGVCTSYLAERLGAHSKIPVFAHSARHFHLPKDPDTPIIMAGHGTGLAPFRAFLQERQAARARGPNWLFFGEQHRRTEFFYEKEWEEYLATGLLTRLDTAFSRDQPQKIYVQHRMLDQARELWSWLAEGAWFYVCGDARRMAPDVDAALHTVARDAGGLTEGEAKEFVGELKRQGRYRKDVY